MTSDDYIVLLDSLGIDSSRIRTWGIDPQVADIKAELLNKYYKTAKQVSGHVDIYCNLKILTGTIVADIFIKTCMPGYIDEVGVIAYRSTAPEDNDVDFFRYIISVSGGNHKEIICKPEEMISKFEEITSNRCNIVLDQRTYQDYLAFKDEFEQHPNRSGKSILGKNVEVMSRIDHC